MHSPVEQFAIKVLFALNLFGFDIQFTNSSLFMVLTVVAATALMVLAVRPRAAVPGRWQLLAELSY